MILLTLSRGKGEETVRLQLPASPAEIGETFAFLDRISLDTTATAILDVSSNVPVLYRCLYDVDVEDSEQFQKLQKLAERTEALSPAKAAIFSGALDAECVWNLEGALTVADRLDEYTTEWLNKYESIKDMAEVIEERFANWQGQDFDEDTLEPSEVAQAIMEYLDCECTYFPSMADDDPIMSAYSYAQRLGVREGFVPVLIQADDETLLECLVMNADPKNDVDIYEFDLKAVTEYRKKMLSTPVKDGKTVLEELTGQRKEEAEDDDMDWDEEVLGEMEGGEPNDRFSSYWDDDTEMTYPLILAKIPVKNPWEIFAYLPFGNWNDCPDTPELMAAAKYWFQQHGAIPAAMSHDELEFELPTPISKERAMEVAVEQYGFCPDLDQNEDGSIGSLADVLWQSTVWYFWWD